MTISPPLAALLQRDDQPFGLRLGTQRKSIVLPPFSNAPSGEEWRYASGTLDDDGIRANMMWFCDTELGVLSSARVTVQVAKARRAAFIQEVAALYEGRFGAPKKGKSAEDRSWAIGAPLKSALSLSVVIDPNGNSKAIPVEKRWAEPLVVISLDLAKGQRIRVIDAPASAPVVVPAVLSELLTQEPPYKAGAKGDHALDLGKAGVPFPASATVQTTTKGRRVVSRTIQLEAFDKDQARLDVFDALEALLTKQWGKPKRTTKETSLESRIDLRWALKTQSIELSTFEFDDGNQDSPTRHVEVTVRATE